MVRNLSEFTTWLEGWQFSHKKMVKIHKIAGGTSQRTRERSKEKYRPGSNDRKKEKSRDEKRKKEI